jgi:phosphoglycolate phosphatase
MVLRMPPHAFFDLDGTLTDPRVGITRSLQYMMRELGRQTPRDANLLRFIGPPLEATVAELLETSDDATIAKGIECYRDRLGTIGLFENEVYPDVPEALARLRAAGITLWVMTVKPTIFAHRILSHFDLLRFFTEVVGSDLSARNTPKATLMRDLMARHDIAAADATMIGDRAFDIEAARSNGVRSVAALWGYGTKRELLAARPDATAETIHDVCSLFEVDRRAHARS